MPAIQLEIDAPLPAIAPTEVRYIKLGNKGGWVGMSFEHGIVSFGYHSIPHEVCVAKDWDRVRELLADRANDGARTAGVGEVSTFYGMGEDCLWITFADGHLWWCFAATDVIWNADVHEDGPSRFRPTIDGWHNTDILGRPLKIASLSSKLTKTANYRSTICTVPERDYLLRRINGVEEPVVQHAREARAAMMGVAVEMVRGLHWRDFETLADLIFARSGWQRSTSVGKQLADIDILMEQPTTGEIAFVQVKSKSNQHTLDDYLERFHASGCDRFFFVCHTAQGSLRPPDGPRLHLFEGKRLADAAVKNGLFDWLVDRSG